jgi:UDP-N-acetylglucosamine--N-acetylmuramyl-(pentapeptide) pyrophosphoryl-undecaprenol N-acetylglucosamine transferase
MNYLISGGGTGGHIFPAISIANTLRQLQPECKILFIGANSRLEMQKIPQASYDIIGLNTQGLERRKIWKNFKIIINFVKSYFKAKKIVKNFKPDVAIGVGGYVSGAAIWAASSLKVPVILQEQNSFAGITNRLLAKKATKICVAYPNMNKFFDKNKIIITGNPVRFSEYAKVQSQEAYDHFNFDKNKKTLLVIGGSLGAKTINESILQNIDKIYSSDIQVILQTGKYYFKSIEDRIAKTDKENIYNSQFTVNNLFVCDFISRMDYAYKIADLVVSRAGASSISELSLLGKPVVLVPSPNVAENHQYHNSSALTEQNAAVLIEDKNAVRDIVPKAITLIKNAQKLSELSENIKKFAIPNSAEKIAEEVIKLSKGDF